MNLEINKYIDFSGLFNHLYDTSKNSLEEHKYEAKHFFDILEFKEKGIIDSFEINIDECEVSDENILFVFTCDFGDSNESCNQSTTADYFISFDCVLEEFNSCEYEQG